MGNFDFSQNFDKSQNVELKVEKKSSGNRMSQSSNDFDDFANFANTTPKPTPEHKVSQSMEYKPREAEKPVVAVSEQRAFQVDTIPK